VPLVEFFLYIMNIKWLLAALISTIPNLTLEIDSKNFSACRSSPKSGNRQVCKGHLGNHFCMIAGDIVLLNSRIVVEMTKLSGSLLSYNHCCFLFV